MIRTLVYEYTPIVFFLCTIGVCYVSECDVLAKRVGYIKAICSTCIASLT